MKSREYTIVVTYFSLTHGQFLCDAMTDEEQQGNDTKEGDATEPNNGLCFAKLFRMKEKDTWEELFVGMCTVDRIVGQVRRTDDSVESRPVGHFAIWGWTKEGSRPVPSH